MFTPYKIISDIKPKMLSYLENDFWNYNYDITEKVCSIALIFIMFYSGFCTKWKVAKSVAKESILLSTLGVFGTAFLVFLFIID